MVAVGVGPAEAFEIRFPFKIFPFVRVEGIVASAASVTRLVEPAASTYIFFFLWNPLPTPTLINILVLPLIYSIEIFAYRGMPRQ